MSDSEMDGRTHIPSLLNALLSRNRVMQMSYLKSKEQGYGKLSSDEDLEIIVDQKQVSEHSVCFLLPLDFDLVALWVQSPSQ
ncbi:hypothetical protein U0070_001586 [Myodes glareolus]|uniref:Uncharacterized protein n=1 Tax=Myodes glareolus TaxID=447135 RepID=A0AAW0IWG7_MYOGA